MRRINLNLFELFLMFLLGGGLLISSCSKDNGNIDVDRILGEENEESSDQVSIILGNDNVTIANRGGERKVDFTTNASWTASSDVDWINIQNPEGEKGKASLRFDVEANSGEERTGTITLQSNPESVSKTITVLQETGISEDFFVKAGGSGEGHSWDDATSLADALKSVVEGGVIHIAAGTYNPTRTISGGDEANDGDLTFELSKNITIIGGYPSDASFGATSDPEVNETILSGEVGSGNAYHVVTVTAPAAADAKVIVKGLTIRDGIANAGANLTINDLTFRRNNAGGVNIGGARVEFEDVNIVENFNVGGHGAGVYVSQGAVVAFTRCKINNNGDINQSNGSNAGALYIDRATVYLYDSEVKNNEARGVASGIYGYPDANIYIYNTEIANNISRSYGGGLYLRESKGVAVNTLIHDNEVIEVASRGGSGVMMYGGSELTLISSTVSHNISEIAPGGGVRLQSGNNIFKVYNSIISGNISEDGGPDIYLHTDNTSQPSINKSVVGSRVLDASGNEIEGESFNPNSMLDNDFVPVGSNNPALTLGMSESDLQTLKGNFDPKLDDRIGSDKNNKSRSGKNIMGSLVE